MMMMMVYHRIVALSWRYRFGKIPGVWDVVFEEFQLFDVRL